MMPETIFEKENKVLLSKKIDFQKRNEKSIKNMKSLNKKGMNF